jgi:predicted O-methyltransferase YrrM
MASRPSNVFACLVHEQPECVVDLVRNLRCLDPESAILLYDGSRDANLLDTGFPWHLHRAVVHPRPRPMSWGRLHDFALDCMRFALGELPFDLMTIVDSDQLAVRPGYSRFLADAVGDLDGLGMLGSAPGRQPRTSRIAPVTAAWREFDLWRGFLREFEGGEREFVHWTFWPATVFTAAAARDLVQLFDTNPRLQDLMRRTRMFATEEVVLPTLTALLGYRIARNPCNGQVVRFRVRYTAAQIDAALRRSDVFWLHPVSRRYDDPLRRRIRGTFDHYRTASEEETTMAKTADPGEDDLLLTWPILERMQRIEGWLAADEADLLIATTARALRELPGPHRIVEIGSYCGRSTVVIASAARASSRTAKVYAVDPHDGKVGAADQGLIDVPPTLEKFQRNVADAGLGGIVETIRKSSFLVDWRDPIHVLFIDGLHDYANVARDFHHFAPWVVEGGYVAFHDYASYYPGVRTFVDELLAGGTCSRVHLARTTMVVRKLSAHGAVPGARAP